MNDLSSDEVASEGAEDRAIARVVVAVRRGDRDAFGQLVERFQQRLFGLVLMMVRNPAGAEEVTQDAFVRAFTKLDYYDERRPFYPWLATIAVRLAQNWLRRRARTTAREGSALEGAGEPQGAVDPLGDLIADERGRQLWRQVATLSSGERTVVVLFYKEGVSVTEIARALGVTGGTVKTLLFRARRHLRQRLADPAPDRPEITSC